MQDNGANIAAIRLLVEQGSATTPALGEAIRYLPPTIVSLLLDAGANPNIRSQYTQGPIIFDVIGTTKQENDMAILLASKGANVNATNDEGMTPVIFAANNARTSAGWKDVWRLVRYLLEETNCDYLYSTKNGDSLQSIIRKIRQDAKDNKITMPKDFYKVVEWLQRHKVDTEPVDEKAS